MRLGTIRTPDGTQAVSVEGGSTYRLPFADVGEVLAAHERLADLDASGEPGPSVESARCAPLVTRPGKIVCVGLNYRTHILEMGRELPQHPTLFAKFATSLIGATEEIVLPDGATSVDWEAELAVVIGATARHVEATRARDVIAGYTVANDISVRDWQWRSSQWMQGKTFDRTTPLGPVLVTGDELGDARDLEISCSVDGIRWQQSRTSDLLFPPAELVAYVSEILTLLPGDVILTGTPGGVGAGADPSVFLSPGQRVVTTIEGIGECRNTCAPEGAASDPSLTIAHARRQS